MLSDIDIRKAIRDRLINIRPFDLDKLGPVSYDLTVGEIYSHGKMGWVQHAFPFLCSVGQVVGTKTLEKITISKGARIAGIESLRSGATRKGLFGSYSFLIDPGFSGKITVTLCPMLKKYKFTEGCSVSQIMFFRTGVVEHSWEGKEKQYGSPL